MKVLSSAEMRDVDLLTSEKHGIPSLQLMENAASRTVEAIEARFGQLRDKRTLVICGPGNNGGDGAAIARLLFDKGGIVDLLLLGRLDDIHGDARTNFNRARDISNKTQRLRLVEIEDADHMKREFEARPRGLYVDAIFGTGLTRAASGIFEQAITILNIVGRDIPIVCVDIPSGISSDSPELIGPAVQAHLTVTFTAPKLGNLLPPASDFNGELIVARIGSPDELIEASGSRVSLIDRKMIADWLSASRRSPHANKGDTGKVLVVAGSIGKTGAACLAGETALRAGAGLVTIATPRSCQPVVASRAIAECMTEPLAETESGCVSAEAIHRVSDLAAERDILVIGPGLGSNEESTRQLVRQAVTARTCPVVIDADGLNCLSPWPEELRGDELNPLILTPHPGEMARLVGGSIDDVLNNQVNLIRGFAERQLVILVLKTSRTLVAAPDGQVFINITGNAGMASGGTGDVLTGLIAGLLAQKPGDPIRAAVAGVYLHGLAGDIAASQSGARSLIASDITARLGDAFIQVGGEGERLVKQSRIRTLSDGVLDQL